MKKWFALAIVISLTSICFAETSNPTTKKKPTVKQDQKQEKTAPVTQEKQELKKPPIVKFSMSMIESGRIDPGYAGIPVSEVVEAIEQITNVAKGEFESTADYNKRKSAALARTFLGNLTVDDTLAFVVPVAASRQYASGLKYNFNADTGEVRLYVLPTSSTLNGIGAPDYRTNRRKSEGLDQFDIDFKIISKNTYQASNAYGATITVDESNSVKHGIAANRIPFLDFKREIIYRNPIPTVQFNMENAKAAKELPSLKALIVMKLADPYVVYNFFHSKPTRDSPNELSSQGKYLTGDVMGIVFYSGINGEILARIPETFGKSEPKPETKAQAQ